VRILIISEVYDPDPAGGQRIAEAASTLASRGHLVKVLARRSGSAREEQRTGNLELKRLWNPFRSGFGFAGKAVAAFWFQLSAFAYALFTPKSYDLLLTVSTPPFSHVAGVIVSRLRGTKHVFWCADVNPEQMIASGIISLDGLIAQLLSKLNVWALRRCDRVVTVGRCMSDLLIQRGANANTIRTVPMWHRDEMAISADENLISELRSRLNVNNRFVVMYSGNFGRVHQFEAVLAAAERLRADQDICFLFSGTGPRLEDVRQEALARCLNARVEGLFPEHMLAAALSIANVHIITLRSTALGVSVPGKLYGVMAAARPAVFVGPNESEVALTIREERCGAVVNPGDVDALVGLIRGLKDDPALAINLGQNGRLAFLAKYCQSYRCAQFSEVIEEAAGQSRRSVAAASSMHLPVK